MPDPFGDDPLEDRARAYLHANCAGCHRSESPTARGEIDLHFLTPFEEMGLCGERPTQGTLYRNDGDELRLLIPSNHEQSVIWARMATTNMFRMPAIGTSVPDTAGLDLIEEWIQSMEECP